MCREISICGSVIRHSRSLSTSILTISGILSDLVARVVSTLSSIMDSPYQFPIMSISRHGTGSDVTRVWSEEDPDGIPRSYVSMAVRPATDQYAKRHFLISFFVTFMPY